MQLAAFRNMREADQADHILFFFLAMTTRDAEEFIRARRQMDPHQLRELVAENFPELITQRLNFRRARRLDVAYCGMHGTYWWQAYGLRAEGPGDNFSVTFAGLYTCQVEHHSDDMDS